MTLICKCYAAECTKTSTKILHVQKSEKRENAPGKAPKSKTRCVLGAGMVENRSELVVADGNTCEKAITFSTDLSRLPARVLLPGGECPELTDAAAENGAVAFPQIAQLYLGTAGQVILSITVTVACLKTSVGLITSCAETFAGMFQSGPSYRVWAIIFSVVSFLFANFGLSTIIEYAVPVLMFLYPLAITLILLALFGKLFHHNRVIYISVTACTLVTALFDLVQSLPYGLPEKPVLRNIVEVGNLLPFSELGLSWVCPAAVGLVIGVVLHLVCRKKPEAA